MTKIRVSKGVREVEGSIREAVVKPFGTSGHIVVARKDIGKVVSVIIPEETEMSWVLSEEDKQTLLTRCKEAIKKKDDRAKRHYQDAVDSFKSKRFSIEDFMNIIGLLETEPAKNKELLEKIANVYDLND
jgi:putative transposon-encoded protein